MNQIVRIHERTLKRKIESEKQLRGCWEGAPELKELVGEAGCEDRWRKLLLLAKATANAPELAKCCLNRTILARLPRAKGKGATREFTADDPKRVAEMARGLNRDDRVWERKSYDSIEKLGLKLYQGILVSVRKFPGQRDPSVRIESLSPALAACETA